MRKLLIITTNFPPNNSVGTLRILRICKYLDQCQWRVYILTLKEKYLAGGGVCSEYECEHLNKSLSVFRTGKFDLLFYLGKLRNKLSGASRGGVNKSKCWQDSDDPKDSGVLRELIDKVRRLGKSLLVFLSDLLQFPDRDIVWVPCAVIAGLRIIKRNRIDVIFSSSPRHSNHLTAVIVKALTGKKLVVEFRDPWARSPWRQDERSKTPYERLKHRLIRVFEKATVERADEVVCVTSEMRDDFAKNYSYLSPGKFKVFYNGYDPDCLKLVTSRRNKGNKLKREKVKFVHTGSLYKLRDPRPLLFAIKELVNKKVISKEEVLFLFVGRVSNSLWEIKRLPAFLGIADIVKFYPAVTYKESLEYMKESDILVLLQPYTRLQIPAKFYDYICHDKPILAIGEKNSAVENIVKDRFGIFVDYDDVESIENGIVKLVGNPSVAAYNFVEHRESFNIAKKIKSFQEILSC